MTRSLNRLSALLTAILFASGVLWAFVLRGMFADGALYLLNIVTSGDFLHVSQTRTSATFVTQTPLVLALRLGVDSLPVLARIQTLALAFVPMTAYAAALWIARRTPWLYCGTVVVVTAVFYPSSFELIGEFHVLYALYWLSFVILVSGCGDRVIYAIILLPLGLALMHSYEVSLLLCGILAVLAVWRAIRSPSFLARPILLLSSCLFVLGSWFGLQGLLYPRDLANMQSFTAALWDGGNQPLKDIAALAVATSVVAFLPDSRGRRVAWLVLTLLALFFVVERIGSRHLGLGAAYEARAQVVPILLDVSVLCLLLPRLPRIDRLQHRWQPWILLVPMLAAFLVDATNTIGWHRFIGSMCDGLARRDSGHADAAFTQRVLPAKFGWDWTYPSLSVLVRPVASTTIIADPNYHGWMPSDTVARASVLARFKERGGICPER